MGTISKNQQDWLDSLTCKRLSSMTDSLLFNFTNSLNNELEQHYCNFANDADLKNENAYYVVRSADEKVLFYFSLKCGLLFEKQITQEQQNLCEAYFDKQNRSLEVKNKLRDYQAELNLSNEQMQQYFSDLYSKIKYQNKAAAENARVSESGNVKIVPQSIPAIELSHFCKNEDNTNFNDSLFPNHKLGEIMFWYFVLPIIEETLKYVGGQYIYLFAVAADENESLINYYNSLLQFDKEPAYGTYKSTYAQSCKFMCLSIDKALKFKNLISNHFEEHWGTLKIS